MADSTNQVIQAPCSTCLGKTKHAVLFEKKQTYENEQCHVTSTVIECLGCRRISMALDRYFYVERVSKYEIYPAPITRRQPPWVLGLISNFHGEDKAAIGAILSETYQAVANGQCRLAAMGIRAALEQVMIATVGDLRTFDDKLDAFQKAGYISLLQRDSMRATLDVGDAAMHRGHLPSEEDLNVALDIVEGVFAPIFAHKDKAQKLGDAVPPRIRQT
jgi:hypothetical protein